MVQAKMVQAIFVSYCDARLCGEAEKIAEFVCRRYIFTAAGDSIS
jgi:hypothetical protein